MASTECSFRPTCRTQERLNIIPSRSVCRQIFGPIDHSQTQTDLKRELAKLNQEATSKWNFDFENDKPLEGKYLWRRMRSKESSTKASSSSGCCKTEESNSSRDVVATVENDQLSANELFTKQELVFSDNDKKITAKRSVKRRLSSQKISDILKKTKRKPSDSKSLISKPLLGRRRSTKRQQQVQLCIQEFLRTDQATSSQA